MDFLVKLLGIEVPENTRLQSAELSFRGLMPVWLAVILLIALAAVIVLLYRVEKGSLGWPRRIFLSIVRVALFALLLILLFRPVLLAEFLGERPRSIVFLLDNSQSMKQQDRRVSESDKMRVAIAKGLVPLTTSADVKSQDVIPADTPKDPSRADLVRWVLEHPQLKLIGGLEKHGPVRPFLFGYSLHGPRDDGGKPKPVPEQLLGSFQAEEGRTGLADAIVEILERKDGDQPAAMVVVTDGQDNASKFTLQEAALECARYQVPLHVYGVGTAEGGSLQLKDFDPPETIFVDDSITVPLRWRAQGFKNGTVEVTLTLGGKQVARRELPLQTGEDLRDALTFIVPKGAEKEEGLDLVATVQVKGSDSFKDSVTKRIQVVDRKIRVLYIEHAPRFVFQFMMYSLLRDRRIEPTFLLVNADPKLAQGGPPYLPAFPPTREKFFDAKYNVIILGDVAASYLGKDHMEWIKEFVQNRGGLIVVAGRQHMPSTYENSPLAEVLPVEFEVRKFPIGAESRTQEYPVTLTDIGQRASMLELADTPVDNLKEWSKLPGFHWQYPLTKLRSGAVSLLVNPRAKMGDQPMPLLATQYYGKGQVLFMGSDETWRWRFNEADKITNRFWGQIIYQMGLPTLMGQTSKRVEFNLERSTALLNTDGKSPGAIYVRLLDKEFNPRKDKQVEAVLEYLDAKPGQERTRDITLFPLPGREGDYRAALPNDYPGRWEVRVKNPETTAYQFRVETPPGHELEEAGLAEKALRDLAQVAGGSFYREEDLHHLAQDVQPQKVSFTRRQEVVLWNPLMMVIFLSLITLEWIVRKFSNLS